MSSIRVLVLCIAASLSVSGCDSTPVADNIAQREANEIVSLLREHGIDASLIKGRGSKSGYSITVRTSRFAEAAGILTRLGLPSDKKASFDELIATSGIIPASRELEALRLDRATAAELEDLLRTQADIAGVSVLVRLRSIEGKGDPTATVVIQKRPGGVVNLDEIRDITARAVPGIKAHDILVSLSEAGRGYPVGQDTPVGDDTTMISFLGISRVPSSEYRSHTLLFIGLSVFVGLLAGLSGYLFGQFSWLRRQAEARKDSSWSRPRQDSSADQGVSDDVDRDIT